MFSRLSNRTLLTLSLCASFQFSVGCVRAQEFLNLKMDKAEKLLLGKTASDQPIESRLDAVEMNLYGKTKHGSVVKRMEGITDFLGIKDDGKASLSTESEIDATAPAVAPPLGQLDTTSSPSAPKAEWPNTTSSPSLPKADLPDTVSASSAPKPAASASPNSLKTAPATARVPALGQKLTPVADHTKAPLAKTASAKHPENGTLAPLKAQEAVMAVPPVAPKHQDAQMPPAAPSIAATMNHTGWNSQARDLLREGLRLHSTGQYREAEATFRQVLTFDPRNADAFYNLGSLAERNHDYVVALTNYRAALNFNPKDKDYIQAVTAMETQLSTSAPQTATVGHFQVPTMGGSSAITGGSPSAVPFQLSGTQNDLLLNSNQDNSGNAPSLSVTQNNPPNLSVTQNNPPTIGVSQRPPKGRGGFGTVMNVGMRFALQGSGLHCPICRMMGGGFHF
jgi:hypothetical protein